MQNKFSDHIDPMKRKQNKAECFYSQTQELELTLRKKPINIQSKRLKMCKRPSKHLIKQHVNTIHKSPIKNCLLLDNDTMIEIEASPLSNKFATFHKNSFLSQNNINLSSSKKKLNFYKD